MDQSRQSSRPFYDAGPIAPTPNAHERPCTNRCLFSATFLILCAIYALLAIHNHVYYPKPITVTVDRATLNGFNLTTTTTTKPYTRLYNLTADISIWNPNTNLGVNYKCIVADACINGIRFGFPHLSTFSQAYENTTVLHPALLGSAASEVAEFESVVDVDVWLYARIRYKEYMFGTTFRGIPEYDQKVKCELRLPLLTDGSTNNGFTRTVCHVYPLA